MVTIRPVNPHHYPHAADPLLNMKNGELDSENKMLESIIIDPNFIVAAAHNANVCLASYSKAQELLDITTVMLENILSCDLGQNDIILLLCCCEPHLEYSGNVSFLNNSSSLCLFSVASRRRHRRPMRPWRQTAQGHD